MLFILTLFAAISVGQLFNKYKTLMALIVLVGFFIVEDIIKGFVGSALNMSQSLETGGEQFISQLSGKLWMDVGVSVIMGAVYFVITTLILSKRANLE